MYHSPQLSCVYAGPNPSQSSPNQLPTLDFPAKQTQTANRSTHAEWENIRIRQLILSGFLLVLLMVFSKYSQAAENTATTLAAEFNSFSDIGTGSLVTQSSNGGYASLTRLNTDITIDVSGMSLLGQVKQGFKNEQQQWVEATYVFPLPADSAIYGMRIKIGERIIEGEIKEKAEAQKIFVEARKSGKRASLVEQQRPNLFTTKVTNIGPGEEIEVEISYLQTLAYKDHEFEIRLPLTLTPRYMPGSRQSPTGGGFVNGDDLDNGTNEAIATPEKKAIIQPTGWSFATDQVGDAGYISPPQVHAANTDTTKSHRANIRLNIEPGFEVADWLAPYHDISVQRHSTNYQIAPKHGAFLMNRDFVVRWRPVAGQEPTAAFFHETLLNEATGPHSTPDSPLNSDSNLVDSKSAAHGLLMLMPPRELGHVQVGPRELVLVIDTSGSMSGASIAQAKQALLMALKRLRPEDYFNVIEFNSQHSKLFSQSMPANQQHLLIAQRFVHGLNANGGTEMMGALKAAMKSDNEQADSSLGVKQIVFITDGSVGNETALFKTITDEINAARLYTVGIGSAPNGYFMRKAAEFGRGTFTWIGSVQEVQEKMSALFTRIEQPLVTDLRVTYHNSGVVESYPGQIPDIYAGEPLIIKAKFQEAPQSITVSGEFNGQFWQRHIVPDWQRKHAGIGVLWAREKIAHLSDEGIKQGNVNLYRDDILKLGLGYKIVTKYTSFVAVDKTPARPLNEPLNPKNIPNLMPEGSQQKAPSMGYPKTALGTGQHIFLGILSLFLGLLVLCLKQDRHLFRIRYSQGRLGRPPVALKGAAQWGGFC